MRRDAEVEQDAIDDRRSHAPENVIEMAEIVVHDVDFAGKAREPFFCSRDGFLILVDADETAAFRKEGGDARGMTRAAERAVHVDAVGLDGEAIDDLLWHHADVMEFCLCHTLTSD